ncbi:hypothetical protein [Methylovirgula sp. 4M-Z18]|uniref:hypothetical protein n=1 Tax=Methylovirgula sp. 4M-Z18 TaxID=2293567 RepID=UPI000E2FD8E6|nr:hypothetical protein [Methylovirgula sp. 4M-Z18]RFB76661.1 hypothetical protein DYH55_19575 [Methylovirgula sp. 4M-Z18]
MRLALKFLLVFAALILGCIAIWKISYPTYSFRYRLTLNVQVNGIVRSGSSVIEMIYWPKPTWYYAGGPSVDFHVRGTAPTVDLGEKGLLFAVFEPGYGHEGFELLPLQAYGVVPLNSVVGDPGLRRLSAMQQPRIDIPPNLVPELVRFRNIDNPKTAENVDPRNLSATFGTGVDLLDATLEPTSDAISEMPSNWPDWLKNLKVAYFLDGQFACGPQSQSLCLQGAQFKGF